MRGIVSLLWKEWRDVRAVVLACMAIVPFALWALHAWVSHHALAEVACSFVLPGVVGLFTAVLASDLVASDVATRRIEMAGLLPVRLGRVFMAKVTLLTVAAFAFATWVGSWAILVPALTAPAAVLEDTAVHLPDAWLLGAWVPLLAACVLFASTFLSRGMTAFVGGGLPVVAFRAYLLHEDRMVAGKVLLGGELTRLGEIVLLVLLTVILLGGAWAAFVRGQVHLAGGFRRFRCGALAVLLGLLGSGGAATAAVRARMDIRPGEPDVIVWNLSASPDGRYAIVYARDATSHLDGEPSRTLDRLAPNVRFRAQGRWILDLESGDLTDLRHLTVDGLWSGAWNPAKPHEVLFTSSEILNDRETRVRNRSVDVATGAAQEAERVLDENEARRGTAVPRVDPPPEVPRLTMRLTDAKPIEVLGWTFAWPSKGIVREFGRSQYPVLRAETGDVVYKESGGEGRIVRWHAVTGESVPLSDGTAGKSVSWDWAKTRGLVLIRDGEVHTVVEDATGALRGGPWRGHGRASWFGDGRYVLLDGSTEQRIIEIESGRVALQSAETLGVGWLYGRLIQLPDGQFLYCPTGQPIVVLDEDLRPVREVYPNPRLLTGQEEGR